MNFLYITFFRKYNKEAGEDTHYTKRSITILQHHSEGRTPIIKNISVIDAQGNEYEATWPKRAKGLVKNGRARFVNETTICLACPPENTEADFMNMENTFNQTSQPEAEPAAVHNTTFSPTAAEPDMSYIIRKIYQIMADSQYIRDALAQLEHAEGAAAMAIGNIVENRENTNQRMIELLQKLLDNLKPQQLDTDVAKLDRIQQILAAVDMDEDYKFDILNQVIQRLF